MWFYPKSTKKAFFSFCKMKRIVKSIFPTSASDACIEHAVRSRAHSPIKLRVPTSAPTHASACIGTSTTCGRARWAPGPPEVTVRPWGEREHGGGVARAAAARYRAGGGMVE